MGDSGRDVVARYLGFVVQFYVAQSQAENPAVREAACQCMSELGRKIDHASVSSFVAVMLEALVLCFQDESWPVRDAACLGLCNFSLSSCFSHSFGSVISLWSRGRSVSCGISALHKFAFRIVVFRSL